MAVGRNTQGQAAMETGRGELLKEWLRMIGKVHRTRCGRGV